MSKRIAVSVFMLFFILIFGINQAWALIASENDRNFRFSLSTPGARANAMGGAFIGLADDATAAYTNPAGLTILTKPEVSFEYKHAEHSDILFDANEEDFEIEDSVNCVSFFSLAYPVKKATFSFYRHNLINYEQNFIEPALDPSVPGEVTKRTVDINAITYGFGLGLKFTEGLSIGLSIGFVHLDYFSQFQSYTDPSLTTETMNTFSTDSEDDAEQYIVSMLWNPFGEFNFGLVYRNNPEFKATYAGLYLNTVNLPDTLGAGISYRFLGSLTVAADVNYVKYSDFLDNYTSRTGTPVLAYPAPDAYISEFDIDDTYEIHAGLEYVFDIKETPFAVRCGYSFIPEHNIRYTGSHSFWQNLYREGEDDHIYSLGFGAVFGNVQFDIAGSYGDFIKEVTLSFVYRFE